MWCLVVAWYVCISTDFSTYDLWLSTSHIRCSSDSAGLIPGGLGYLSNGRRSMDINAESHMVFDSLLMLHQTGKTLSFEIHVKLITNQTSTWTSWKPPWPDMNLDQLSLHKFAQFLLCGFWVPNPMLAKCRSASLARPSEFYCKNLKVTSLISFACHFLTSYHSQTWDLSGLHGSVVQSLDTLCILITYIHFWLWKGHEQFNPSKWVSNRNSKCGLWPKREAGQTCKEIPIQMLQNWWNQKQSELHTVGKHTRMADGLYLARFHQCLWTSLDDLMWGMPTWLDPRSKWLPHCWSMKCLWGARWWPSGKKRRTKFDP